MPGALLVVAGGVAGTLARYGIAELVPTHHGWPIATMVVNVVGAFALGVLLERLVVAGPGSPRRRNVRLLAGTGFLGSFTTYSSLAVETERLLAGGAYVAGVAYVVASVIFGLVACLAGVAIAPRTRRQRNVVR